RIVLVVPPSAPTRDTADDAADGRAKNRAARALGALIALRIIGRLLGLLGSRNGCLPSLLDGPVVAFVAVATQLIGRLVALRVDAQSRQILGRHGGSDTGHRSRRRDQSPRIAVTVT